MDHLLNFHFNILLGKINGCLKSIDLGNIFDNLVWEKKKTIDFLMGFYMFHKSGLKLSKNSQLKKIPKDIREQNPISIKGPISF